MIDIQALVNAMGKAGEETRSQYHLTLGRLVAELEKADGSLSVQFEDGGAPCEPHSYRGYYSDLAFESDPKPITVSEFLDICRQSLGASFEGYKGGDFEMHEATPLWRSNYGVNSEIAIMGTAVIGDRFVLVTRDLRA